MKADQYDDQLDARIAAYAAWTESLRENQAAADEHRTWIIPAEEGQS
jgi:hypothetical protein